MDEAEIKRLMGSAVTDQMAEAFCQMAVLIARYYRALLDENVEPDLVDELTMQMAGMVLHRTLWPGEVPE